MSVYDLTVVVQEDEQGNHIAICPMLQGCYADGKTLEEALGLIQNVNKLHIEDRLESGETIPVEQYSSQLKIAV